MSNSFIKRSPGGLPATAAETHRLGRSLAYHLLPGVAIMIGYLVAVGPVRRAGYPAMMAMLLAILFVAIPAELGELYRRARSRGIRRGFGDLVPYRRSLPVWKSIALVVGYVVFAALISAVAGLGDLRIAQAMTGWLPEWFFMNQPASYAGVSRSALMVTLAVNLVLNGIAAPIVEELYFRGWLLSRLARFGAWAPLINAVLFTVYHFWQPYAWLSILAISIPLAYLVWYTRSIRLGIYLHCSLNIVGNLLLFGSMLA